MRIYLSFLLAIMLSLNAAYATAVGICDALEQTQSHGLHIGHHSHEHSDDHDAPSSSTETDKIFCLDHAHPSFSFILPGIIGVMPLIERSPLVAIPASTFVSIPQALLDRPPRATLA